MLRNKYFLKIVGVMESLKGKHILLFAVVLLLLNVVQNTILIIMMSKIQGLFLLPSYESIAKNLLNDVLKNFNVQLLDNINTTDKKPDLGLLEKSKEVLLSFNKREYYVAGLLLGTLCSVLCFWAYSPEPIYGVVDALYACFINVSTPLSNLVSGVQTAFGTGIGFFYSTSEVAIRFSFFGVKAVFGITRDLGKRSLEVLTPLITLSRERSESVAPIAATRSNNIINNFLPEQMTEAQDALNIQRLPSPVNISPFNNNFLNTMIEIEPEDPEAIAEFLNVMTSLAE